MKIAGITGVLAVVTAVTGAAIPNVNGALAEVHQVTGDVKGLLGKDASPEVVKLVGQLEKVEAELKKLTDDKEQQKRGVVGGTVGSVVSGVPVVGPPLGGVVSSLPVRSMGETVGGATEGALDTAGSAVQSGVHAAGSAVNGVMSESPVKRGVVGATLGSVVSTVPVAGPPLGGVVSTLPVRSVGETVGSTVEGAVDTVGSTVNGVTQKLPVKRGVVGATLGSVVSTVPVAGPPLGGVVSTLPVRSVGETVGSTVEGAVDTVGSTVNGVTQKLPIKRDDPISSLAGQLLPGLLNGGILPQDVSLEQLTGLLNVLQLNGLIGNVQQLLNGLLGGLPLQGLTSGLLKRDDPISSLAGQLLPGLLNGGILPSSVGLEQLTGLLNVLQLNGLLGNVEQTLNGLLGGLPLQGLTGGLLGALHL